jgi:flagellin
MSVTQLSSASRASLFALRDIAAAIQVTQNRLATGKKVNTALDNPASFFTAAALNSRAASLNTIFDKVTAAVKTVEAADKAITAIRSLVANAQSLATQALASPNTLAKFTGTVSGLTATSGLGTLDNGDEITVSDGTTTVTYVHNTANDVQDFLDAVNASGPLQVTASLDSSGRVVLQADSTNNIIIGAQAGATAGEIDDIGLVTGTTTFTANATRQSLAAQYDSIRTQIDQLIGDASYNGVNLLQGNTLNVVFNETGSSSLSISTSALSATSLGISAAKLSNGGIDFQTDASINADITELATATTTLASKASDFGSHVSTVKARETFNKAMIDTLNAGADALVLSDPNEEAATLLALQTRQQIATTALSLTNESEKNVLRLFGF